MPTVSQAEVRSPKHELLVCRVWHPDTPEDEILVTEHLEGQMVSTPEVATHHFGSYLC